MEFFKETKNDLFSKLRGLDLQELIYQIECFDLEYRDSLNLPNKLTFGTEIEYENLSMSSVSLFISENLKNWNSKYDGSVPSGGEVSSRILTDTENSWYELKKICEFLKQNKAENSNDSGAHIHVGAHILGDNKENWLNFIKLYIISESVLFRFFYGDKINARGCIFDYAQPVANKLYNSLEYLNKLKDVKLFSRILVDSTKYYAINFKHVKFNNTINTKSTGNTIELRCPNGTIEEVIWQNNINAFAKLILKAKSDKLDIDLINYKLENEVVDSEKQFYMYNEIRLKAVLEFVDLVFNNNLDKVYFLKQYLKGFSDNYKVYDLVTAKKFVKGGNL